MRRLVCLIVLASFLWPGMAVAQQIDGVAQGNVLQSGSGGLQQTPTGFQGSTPQVFGTVSGSNLDQNGLSLAPVSTTATTHTEVPTANPTSLHDNSGDDGARRVVFGAIIACATVLCFTWFLVRRQT